MRARLFCCWCSFACAGLATVVWADPPARIARMSYASGMVTFRPAALDTWTEANVNYPLTTGDHLWTEAGARAEIHIGGMRVRMAPHTALSFLEVGDDAAQLRIAEGSVAVTVVRLDPDETAELDTPNSAVSLLRDGVYRIDVNPGGHETTVTVRRGRAEVTAAGAAVPVGDRQALFLDGVESPLYDVQDPPAPDAWEEWWVDRDRRAAAGASRRYVSAEIIGYEVPPQAVASVRPAAAPAGVQVQAASIVVAPARPVPQPPAAVLSRPVVALATPPPPPPLFGQTAVQAQATNRTLLRPAAGAGIAGQLKPRREGLLLAHPAAVPKLRAGHGPDGAQQPAASRPEAPQPPGPAAAPTPGSRSPHAPPAVEAIRPREEHRAPEQQRRDAEKDSKRVSRRPAQGEPREGPKSSGHVEPKATPKPTPKASPKPHEPHEKE